MRQKPLPVVVEEKKMNSILAGWSLLDNIIFPPFLREKFSSSEGLQKLFQRFILLFS